MSGEASEEQSSQKASALRFEVLAKCSVSNARVSLLHLPHYSVQLPVFMPVGTQGTLKGLTPEQLKALDCEILLGNTYHLGHRPGPELLESQGGLHKFMNWDRAILTDSGGFQMVSLSSLSELKEGGVSFMSPHDSTMMFLSPEESMRLQNIIGADIMMQLDDVINTLTETSRHETATYRSIRWLDRCIQAHSRPKSQNLFGIIQGGLDLELRAACLEEMIVRDCPGYAIGGLSGGEDKTSYCKIVKFCTEKLLPLNKPIYCMGIGYTDDLIVSVCLGVDMFDCVFPTRTARFGHALVASGDLALKKKQFEFDFSPIDPQCSCLTCQNFTRAYLHSIVTKETIACHYLSIHNLAFLFGLMASLRTAIKNDTLPSFVASWFNKKYNLATPQWIVDACKSVNISI